MPILQHGAIHIEYQDVGQGPAVILIHSSGTGMGQWRKLMEALAPRYRAIAYNRFGCGDTSPWPNDRPQTLEDQADLALALAEHAGGRVHLVGHSFGGSVAIKAAKALGDRVASLSLLEPNPFNLLQQHGRTAAYAESCAVRDLVKTHGKAGEWERAAEGFADYWNAPGAWAGMKPERRAAFLKMMPSNFYEWDCMSDEADMLSVLAPVAGRTLVVTARDTVAPIRHIGDILHNNLPDLTFEQIPEGGHMAPLTRPDVVNPLVIAHMGRFAA